MIFLLQNEVDIFCVVVGQVGDVPGLLQCFVFEVFYFFILAGDDSFKKLMVVVGFIELKVLAYFGHELLEVFDLLTALQGLIGDLPHLGWQVGFFQFVLSHGNALLIETEEGLHELQEKEVIVTDEGRKSIFGVMSGAAGVPLVGNFVPQVGDDLIEGLKVADILAN